MIKCSLRNTVKNEEEFFRLLNLSQNHSMRIVSVTNQNDVTLFTSKDFEPYRVPGKNHFKVENILIIPGILLWVTYAGKQNIPIVGYDFNAEQLQVELEKAFAQMPEDQQHLNSYKAIELIKNAGGQVFLATSNMHPFPNLEKLDEIFVHHPDLDGLEAFAPAFQEFQQAFYQQYALSMGKQIAGGDGYSPDLPAHMFGQTCLPAKPLTFWLRTL